MNKLIKSLNIDETFTKPKTNKQKTYNHIKNNLPNIADYNFMADLIQMPETKNGFKYILSVVDLATNEFDIEPLKNKTPEDVLLAIKKMFKRPYLKKPYASIRTDNGNEFKGIFQKWCNDEKIFHKLNIPNRHTQMANIESLNNQLARLFNGYMNYKEKTTGKIYKNWDDVIDIIRKDLNKIRKIKVGKFDINDYPFFTYTNNPKFKIGEIVHFKLDYPENALGHKQPTSVFRVGDYRLSAIPKKIVKVLNMNDSPYYRYILEGMPNVSYSEYQLIKSKEKDTKYKVKAIIGDRINKNKKEYLVWWKNYKKNESTYEPKNKLIEDGLIELIRDYELNKKKV